MNDEIVLSSRIRLARNIDGYPFFLSDERAPLLVKTVFDVLKKIDRFCLYRMTDFCETEALAMMERHLISPDLIKNKKYGAAVVSEDESVSIMVNEEDHIRAQCILGGLSLDGAYKKLSLIDNALAGELKFAFSQKYGYLTSCLTNVGTGMRASVMMFLPALTITGSLPDCINNAARLNMAVRGVYGEGSDSHGFIYQISNQRTLGISEVDIYRSVQSTAEQIARTESKARDYLLRSAPAVIKDKISRSYGILTNCYKIDHNEFIASIAFVKLGVYYGILNLTDRTGLNELITEMGSANLSIHLKDGGGSTEAREARRDILRAQNCVRRLKKLVMLNGDYID
ncbi:MAG: ATP--guanido phosphotransferase [Firmicutes bacterium]|nr:ATP--guanido phosphotransferase [Bacillota bacterium]